MLIMIHVETDILAIFSQPHDREWKVGCGRGARSRVRGANLLGYSGRWRRISESQRLFLSACVYAQADTSFS